MGTLVCTRVAVGGDKQGPQLLSGAQGFKLAEISRATLGILQVEELGFSLLCCRLFSFKASAATL